MAKRNRYREMERYVTYALVGDGGIFLLYLLCAGTGAGVWKWILAAVGVVLSGLGLGLLYLNGELLRRRSLWMSAGFGAVLLCLLVSLALNYPSPNPNRVETNPGSSYTGSLNPSDTGSSTGTGDGSQDPSGTSDPSGTQDPTGTSDDATNGASDPSDGASDPSGTSEPPNSSTPSEN